MEGLARWNTHVKYESPSTYHSKVMTKVKVFEKKVKLHGQRSQGQGRGIKRKVLPEGIHVKYENPSTYQSKVMAKVKVFAD
jgi:hypothetical protein